MLGRAVWLFWEQNNEVVDNVTHNSRLEVIWTVTPSVILLLIAIPSFSLLYSMEELARPMLTVKAIGRQWYWTYEIDAYRRDFVYNYTSKINKNFDNVISKKLSGKQQGWFGSLFKFSGKYRKGASVSKDFPKNIGFVSPGISFDSVMVQEEELKIGELRLLEVDNRLLIPLKTHVRVLTTSSDVIHSWAVPSFGIKMDAIPGRLNQTMLFVKRPGVYYGQCSELCGVNHGYMPIVVEVVDHKTFTDWARAHSKLTTIVGASKKVQIRELDVSQAYRDA